MVEVLAATFLALGTSRATETERKITLDAALTFSHNFMFTPKSRRCPRHLELFVAIFVALGAAPAFFTLLHAYSRFLWPS